MEKEEKSSQGSLEIGMAGSATGQIVRNLDALLDEYYDALGYTRQGIPLVSKLKELGLGEE